MPSTPAAAPSKVPPPPRPRKPANPLVRPKRPVAPKTQPPNNVSTKPGRPSTQNSFQPLTQHNQQIHQQPQESYEDTPIYTTKRALVEGTRHHIMRLFPSINVDKLVDPRDQSQFTPPIRLHRRDPRKDPAPNLGEGSSAETDEKKPNLAEDKAREEANVAKAARAAERHANKAQIAPTAKSEAATHRKQQRKQKKIEMVFQFTDSAPKVKNQKIRYEESMPWHLEDFDNKNLWAGTYESALSERHVMLIEEPESKAYRMVPLEKWYKFLPKSHIKITSHEDAERHMKKQQTDVPDLVRKAEAEQQKRKQDEATSIGKLFTRQGERGERPIKGGRGDGERPEQNEDADVLDYDYDEAFADDEEAQLFGGDEDEIKEAEQKVKREWGDANIFKDIKEQKDFDKEEADRKRREEHDKEKKKALARALKKRERDWRYEDDSDELSESSEDETEEGKDAKTEEEKNKDEANGITISNADKAKSGASTKGTSTPVPDSARNGLKRPVSPSQSDLSGNESSRKKQKKAHTMSNIADVGASISRTSSAASQLGGPRKALIKLNTSTRRNDGGAASGSEGEMSDRSKGKRKSHLDSRQVSPNGSRASSPANGARAPTKKGPSEYTEEDIRARVGHEGVPMTGMIKIFGNEALKDAKFVALMRKALRMDQTTKLLKPRPREPLVP